MDRSDPIQLRTFRFPADFDPVLRLWSGAGQGIHLGRSDTLEEIQKKVGRDPDLFLLAEVGGALAGSVMGGFDGRRGLVYHLAVSESFRRRKVGSLLMQELERRLRARGCLRVLLLVTPENLRAQHFYAGLGWEKMDLLVYGKDIA